MTRLLLATTAILAACVEPASEPRDTAAPPGGTTPDEECSNVFPILSVGMTWTYEYVASVVGGWTTVARGRSRPSWLGEAAWQLETQGSFDSATSTYTWSTRTYYRCAEEGVVLLGLENEYEQVDRGTATTYAGSSRQTYTKDHLVWPKKVSPGDDWLVESEGTLETEDGSQSFTYRAKYTVGDVATVTVPAGTFDAYLVSVETLDDPSSSYDQYVAPDIGSVQGATFELMSVEFDAD